MIRLKLCDYAKPVSAARGNSSLASTVQLTTALRHDINEFGKRVSEVTESKNTIKPKTSSTTRIENVASVLESMKDLLRRIEDVCSLSSLELIQGCATDFTCVNYVRS